MSKPNQNNNLNDELLSVVPGSQSDKHKTEEVNQNTVSLVENSNDNQPSTEDQEGIVHEETVQKEVVQEDNQESTSESSPTEDYDQNPIQENVNNMDLSSTSSSKKPKTQKSGAFSLLMAAKKQKSKSKANKQTKASETSPEKQAIEEETPDQKMLKALKKEQKRIRGKKTYWKTLTNTICVLILISSISVLAATLWLPFLKVYTNNMSPALNKDDIVMVVKQSHLEPGELIGFYYNNKLMIKRVIAKAGDVVNIDDNGVVYVNDTPLDEPYISNQQKGDASIEFPYTVPEAQLFVLSDDRSNLLDSRNYAIQSIAEELILGKVTLRVWPIQDIRIF